MSVAKPVRATERLEVAGLAPISAGREPAHIRTDSALYRLSR
jgi:hypothetical protein